jgi:Domain of unknown function (DUF4252)
MKNILRSLSATAILSLAFATVSRAAEPESGYIDFGQLLPSAKGEFVEINLSPMLLKFAARLATQEEPESAALLANLKRVRVNVVGLDDSNRADTIGKIESIRRTLESQGWAKMVTVREQAGGDNVDVHVKQNGEDAIDGIVITVIDKKGQAVFVNIVGNIQADQIAKIAEKFDIEPLRKLHLKFEQKDKDKERVDDKQAQVQKAETRTQVPRNM